MSVDTVMVTGGYGDYGKSSAAARVRDYAGDVAHALVVDDDVQVRGFIAASLRSSGWAVSEAESAERAVEMMHERRWALVFCDVVMGRRDGYSVLRRFSEEQPGANFVLMTGHGSAAGALDATALGAQDYLLKPFGVADVQRISGSIRARLEEGRPGRRGPGEAPPGYVSDIDLIGHSPAFIEVMKTVGRVSQTSLPVLLVGESGTGKEVIARAIHRRSSRGERTFVAVNCGAITADLIESELFGHVRGAFTGADRDRVGLWEEAHGGSIFLDEITETSSAFQVKLLRALQEGEIRRVGSNRVAGVDARVIAASNRDVDREVAEGRFRQDLLFRLNAVTICLPPLRERREDVLPLARWFARRYQHAGGAPLSFSAEAGNLLENYPWPGNIRELENTVVRGVALCDGTIRPEDLPERIRRSDGGGRPDSPCPMEPRGACGLSYVMTVDEWTTLEELEGRYVARALEHTAGNKLAASRLLNVDRKTLDRMLRRHGISLRSKHEAELGQGEAR